MDYGLWAEAERSFRRAAQADANFIISKSLVARISTDLSERLELQREIEARIGEVDADGRLLLDVFLLNIQGMNDRDQGLKPGDDFNKRRQAIAIENFGRFLHKYPDDVYIMAEYVEWVHRVEGPAAALATIENDLTETQKIAPFFLRYAASLTAETGKYSEALAQAGEFEALLSNPGYPEQYVLYAEIFQRMGRLEDAGRSIARAVELDPRHIIAVGLQSQIQDGLASATAAETGIDAVPGQLTKNQFRDQLVRKPTDGLGARSLEIHRSAVAVLLDADDDALKQDYLSAFPESFEEFLQLFNPRDFSELYADSYIYLDLFHRLSLEFPELAVPKYLSLARDACFDVDAPSQFYENLVKIRERFPDRYATAAKALTEDQLRRIELLGEVSVHDWEPAEVMCRDD